MAGGGGGTGGGAHRPSAKLHPSATKSDLYDRPNTVGGAKKEQENKDIFQQIESLFSDKSA